MLTVAQINLPFDETATPTCRMAPWGGASPILRPASRPLGSFELARGRIHAYSFRRLNEDPARPLLFRPNHWNLWMHRTDFASATMASQTARFISFINQYTVPLYQHLDSRKWDGDTFWQAVSFLLAVLLTVNFATTSYSHKSLNQKA